MTFIRNEFSALRWGGLDRMPGIAGKSFNLLAFDRQDVAFPRINSSPWPHGGLELGLHHDPVGLRSAS